MLNHDTPEQQSLTLDQIITDAGELMPQDEKHLQHDVIQRFGSPLKPIYVNLMCAEKTGGFNLVN